MNTQGLTIRTNMKIFKMSRLKAVNIFLLQWFFIRLTKHRENRLDNFEIRGYDLMSDGTVSPRGKGVFETYQWYSIQFWVLPLTGWWSVYIYLNTKPKYTKVSKEKLIEH